MSIIWLLKHICERDLHFNSAELMDGTISIYMYMCTCMHACLVTHMLWIHVQVYGLLMLTQGYGSLCLSVHLLPTH